MDVEEITWSGKAWGRAKKGSEFALTQDGKYVGVGMGWHGFGGGVKMMQRLGLACVWQAQV